MELSKRLLSKEMEGRLSSCQNAVLIVFSKKFILNTLRISQY